MRGNIASAAWLADKEQVAKHDEMTVTHFEFRSAADNQRGFPV